MREPDIEAIITCKRRIPFYNGYRPAHSVKEDYLTTGIHQYYSDKCIPDGESALGTITFTSPEEYPNCLWEGKVLRLQEGGRIVGYATITKIFNEILRAKE
jgi:translation elongation factor EF-Tu-like GTPase